MTIIRNAIKSRIQLSTTFYKLLVEIKKILIKYHGFNNYFPNLRVYYLQQTRTM